MSTRATCLVPTESGILKRFRLDWLSLLIGLGVIIRLAFIGLVDLLPEEAYYWNYSQHLDLGYLDHPPMVAWLIHLSEAVLGRSEFAVRLPAFLGWFVLAFFMYRLTESTVGKAAGKPVILLLASLPIYMSVGFLMTPDAPFYVCWAGALLFLERAIIAKRTSAWYVAGACLGLGLLSKYTMGLVVPATIVFLLVDKDSRGWFRSPHPYLAMLIGMILFTPVLSWNAQNEWASFAFQGSRRWSGGIDFHLHILLGSILVLITPTGVFDATKSLLRCWKHQIVGQENDRLSARKSRFLAVFAMVPLTVFVVHSIQGQPKLNWTGPVWLALLPLIATAVSKVGIPGSRRRMPMLSRRWFATATSLLVFYAAGFGYLVAGMPGAPKGPGMTFPIAWRALGDRLEEIETDWETATNSEPVVLGLDKYWLASEASFYDMPDSDMLDEFAGFNVVGRSGLMWNWWTKPEMLIGRDAILISFREEDLLQSSVGQYFSDMSEINEEILRGYYCELGRFYWRIGRGYSPKVQLLGDLP